MWITLEKNRPARKLIKIFFDSYLQKWCIDRMLKFSIFYQRILRFFWDAQPTYISLLIHITSWSIALKPSPLICLHHQPHQPIKLNIFFSMSSHPFHSKLAFFRVTLILFPKKTWGLKNVLWLWLFCCLLQFFWLKEVHGDRNATFKNSQSLSGTRM